MRSSSAPCLGIDPRWRREEAVSAPLPERCPLINQICPAVRHHVIGRFFKLRSKKPEMRRHKHHRSGIQNLVHINTVKPLATDVPIGSELRKAFPA